MANAEIPIYNILWQHLDKLQETIFPQVIEETDVINLYNEADVHLIKTQEE